LSSQIKTVKFYIHIFLFDVKYLWRKIRNFSLFCSWARHL